MAPSSILLILLPLFALQMLLTAMPTPHCHVTDCHLAGNVVQDTHQLLRDMGGNFPQHCRPYNTIISFPDSIIPAANCSQCRKALWVVHKSLEGMLQMFEMHELPMGEGGLTWDEQKLDNFFNRLDRLEEEGRRLSSDMDASGHLSSYFRNVTTVIEQQDSAACGWEALRRDVIKVLKSTLKKHHTCFCWSQAH